LPSSDGRKPDYDLTLKRVLLVSWIRFAKSISLPCRWCSPGKKVPVGRPSLDGVIILKAVLQKRGQYVGTGLNLIRGCKIWGFTAVTMKNAVFRYVTPCGSCKNRCAACVGC
jgi:hypothetical protein